MIFSDEKIREYADDIALDLQIALDRIFAEHQAVIGIIDGGTDPMSEWELDIAREKMAAAAAKILYEQEQAARQARAPYIAAAAELGWYIKTEQGEARLYHNETGLSYPLFTLFGEAEKPSDFPRAVEGIDGTDAQALDDLATAWEKIEQEGMNNDK